MPAVEPCFRPQLFIMTGRPASDPVALGYADEDIDPALDVDPYASKLGGRPVWLDDESPVPLRAAAACQQCGSAMLLLAQAYVPLRDSPYDRVLYVWACNRRACSGKPGAAKAIRAHMRNEEYARTLARRTEGASRPRPPQPKQAGLPGSLFAGTTGPAEPLDFGSVWRADASRTESPTDSAGLFSGLLFGKRLADPGAAPAPSPKDDAGLASRVEQLSIASEPAAAAVAEGEGEVDASRAGWDQDVPAVPAVYLAFEDEEALGTGTGAGTQYRTETREAMEAAADGDGGADERYERDALPKGTDAAFARFSRVVSRNPEQVLRYQFGGAPLLYTAQDETARLLLRPQSRACPSGGDSDSDSDADGDCSSRRQGYSTDQVPRCPRCGARRVFECQIMPALLSVLPLSSYARQTAGHSADLRAAAAQGLAGSQLLRSVDLGAEFGTVLVFVCEADCHGGPPAASHRVTGAAYYDELVLVQQEAH
ncbi:hypothetical protein H4R19_000057 [Coemansia spiralis]|nr:hypothetical protein H4R19_000057 [Coemansia spiralis]